MIITWSGDNYFKIQAGAITALIDPLNQRSLKGATFVLKTTTPEENALGSDNPPTFNHQGEYETQGVHIQGWTENGTTIYKFLMDDMTVVVLGHLTKEPSAETQEYLQDADIMIVPAGRKPFLSPASTAKLIRQLEPALVIPALFDNLKPFLNEMEQDKCPTEDKITIKKKDLKPKAMLVRCLNG